MAPDDGAEVQMSTRGINAKRWFYDLRGALRKDAVNARRIFSGAACEQWVNGQIFSTIAGGLRGSPLTAYPEWNRRQHDCAVLRVGTGSSDTVVDWHDPVAVTETKLLYASYPERKRAAYVRRLLEQLAADSSAHLRIGFVIGIYAWSEQWPAGRPAEDFGSFRRSLGGVVKEEIASPPHGFAATLAKPTMETLLDERTIRVGAARVHVGCVGQYVTIAI